MINVMSTSGANNVASVLRQLRVFKLEIDQIVDWTENSVQLACVKFYFRDAEVMNATAENPGGFCPDHEGPENAVDGNINTKFLDFNIKSHGKSILLFTFPNAQMIDEYEIFTANDAPGRDPTSWLVLSMFCNLFRWLDICLFRRLFGSIDIGQPFIKMHAHVVTAPSERHSSIGRFSIQDGVTAPAPDEKALNSLSFSQWSCFCLLVSDLTTCVCDRHAIQISQSILKLFYPI
jgi:hypothetical protein